MTVYLDRVGAESDETEHQWDPSACSLYALAVGAGFDQAAYVNGEAVYPTFALSLAAAESANWPDPAFATGDFDLHSVVLGQQALVLHRPVQPSGRVRMRTRVGSIVDKGSGALITLEAVAVDAATGEPAFTAASSLFVVGEGGFGGDRGSSAPAHLTPDGPPDHIAHATTSPIQTLLYRHAGNDDNPVHVNPEFARAAGFDGPILTGQNTMGFACRALVECLAAGDATKLTSIEGRFEKPAYNGDVLTTEIWADGNFTVSTQRAEVVVGRGWATFAP